MSTEASAFAVATIATESEISRTVNAMLVFVVSPNVATNTERSTRAARKAAGSSISPTITS